MTLRITSKSLILWHSNLFGCRGTTWGREDLRQNRAWTKQRQAWGRKGNVTLSQNIWSQSFWTFSEDEVGKPPRETKTKQPNRASQNKRGPKLRDEKMKALHLDSLRAEGAGAGKVGFLFGVPLTHLKHTSEMNILHRERVVTRIQKSRH